MWFDSHCHLHLCDEAEGGWSGALDRARAAGVLEMLAVAIDLPSSKEVVDLAKESGVYASAGLHPNSATEWSDEARDEIDRLLDLDAVVAVGETGLDFYRDYAPQDLQREVFAAHIDFAKKHDKALVIHTRDSADATIEMLQTAGPPDRLIFHCWSGDEVQTKKALNLGAYVSFAGNISFKSAQALRDVSMVVPEERLLVETDSPYLSPEPHRGKPNEPRQVAFVGLAVADARGVSSHLLAEQTKANARRVFGIEGPLPPV